MIYACVKNDSAGPAALACSRPRLGCAGFTLLEALVALVVISIGLLGLLGLQTVSVVNTQLSEGRTVASIAADDISNRITANPAGAKAGNYDTISDPYTQGSAVPSPDCLQTVCTAKQMATLDAWEWGQSLFARIGGHGFVRCTGGRVTAGDPCQAYMIVVAWNERETSANGDDAQLRSCDAPASIVGTGKFNQCFVTDARP